MRYWHMREVSDRLRNDRLYRKEAREPQQLPSAIGFAMDDQHDIGSSD